MLTDAGDVYLFPTAAILAKRALTLCGKYERYRLTGPRQMVVGEGFEPSKAEPRGLQPRSFGHSDIPPGGAMVWGATKPLQPDGDWSPSIGGQFDDQEGTTVADSSFDVVA